MANRSSQYSLVVVTLAASIAMAACSGKESDDRPRKRAHAASSRSGKAAKRASNRNRITPVAQSDLVATKDGKKLFFQSAFSYQREGGSAVYVALYKGIDSCEAIKKHGDGLADASFILKPVLKVDGTTEWTPIQALTQKVRLKDAKVDVTPTKFVSGRIWLLNDLVGKLEVTGTFKAVSCGRFPARWPGKPIRRPQKLDVTYNTKKLTMTSALLSVVPSSEGPRYRLDISSSGLFCGWIVGDLVISVDLDGDGKPVEARLDGDIVRDPPKYETTSVKPWKLELDQPIKGATGPVTGKLTATLKTDKHVLQVSGTFDAKRCPKKP